MSLTATWQVGPDPNQILKDSIMLAYLKGGWKIQKIELGESNEQHDEREQYDGDYGDAGITWLVNGNPDLPADGLILAWIEVPSPQSLLKVAEEKE